MKTAIVTFEFEGLTRNGGIGTAYRRLAELLASNGHDVTILFMPFSSFSLDARNQRLIKSFARRGIKVVLPELVAPKINVVHEPFHTSRSYHLYEYLKTQHFDVVHSSDNGGLIYFSLLAKRFHLAFEKTRFVIGTHGCLKWVAEANGIYSTDSVLLSELDHSSIEMADYVVSPSAYMLSFREAKGWTLPADSRVIANVNDLDRLKPDKALRTKTIRKGPPLEKVLVFFGRIERRKGIFIFLKAVEKLLHDNPQLGAKKSLEVVLLGSSPENSVRTAVEHAICHLKRFGSRLKLKSITDLSSDESLDFLAGNPRHLVCMPSLIDNFPYVIVEAVERRLDFIASDAGGQSEIISAEDRAHLLCPPTVDAWAQAIEKRLTAPKIEAVPAKTVTQANRAWLMFHKEVAADLRAERRRKNVRPRQPRVSVILTRVGYHHELLNSLQSALNQDYADLEVLVPDDIGLHVTSKSIRGYPSRQLSPSELAKMATGKYILFLDGGVFHRANTLGDWVRACESLPLSPTKYLGFSSVIRHGVFNERPSNSVPLPASFTRALIGHCIANTFTLWNRQGFIDASAQGEADFTHDSALRPFVLRALTKGFALTTVPIFGVVTLTDRFLQNWSLENAPPPLDALSMRDLPSASESVLTGIVAFYSDMIKYRDLYYQQRIRHSSTKRK